MKNNLPPTWFVMNDGSEKFKAVLDYINERFQIIEVDCESSKGMYCGFVMNEPAFKWNCPASDIIPLDQFIEFTKPRPPFTFDQWIEGYGICDQNGHTYILHNYSEKEIIYGLNFSTLTAHVFDRTGKEIGGDKQLHLDEN